MVVPDYFFENLKIIEKIMCDILLINIAYGTQVEQFAN